MPKKIQKNYEVVVARQVEARKVYRVQAQGKDDAVTQAIQQARDTDWTGAGESRYGVIDIRSVR